MGQGRDAGKVLEEIEDQSLGGEERSHGSADSQERRGAGLAEAAFDDLHVEAGILLDAEAFVIGLADHGDDRQPADEADLALDECADADLIVRHKEAAGHIAVGPKVFALGEKDQVFDVIVEGKVP